MRSRLLRKNQIWCGERCGIPPFRKQRERMGHPPLRKRILAGCIKPSVRALQAGNDNRPPTRCERPAEACCITPQLEQLTTHILAHSHSCCSSSCNCTYNPGLRYTCIWDREVPDHRFAQHVQRKPRRQSEKT